MAALASYLDKIIDPAAPLIIAGDFNDWRNHAGDQLAASLGLREVFSNRLGMPVRSFPAALPMFRLDRVYVRGFEVLRTEVHHGQPWSKISDHAALSAHLTAHGS
jgi:endonuclease/exonuclease/phosphatase family metal-dependent hydrolase